MRAGDRGMIEVVWKSTYLEESICHVYSFHSTNVYQTLTICRQWSRHRDTVVKINKISAPMELTL